jgi:hypothetical protein
MGLGRVELPTSRLSGVRSNHLSYRPLRHLLTACGTESCKLAAPWTRVNPRAPTIVTKPSSCFHDPVMRPDEYLRRTNLPLNATLIP